MLQPAGGPAQPGHRAAFDGYDGIIHTISLMHNNPCRL